MIDAIKIDNEEQIFPASYQRVHEHVFGQIEAAQIQLDPFPHCYVRNVFPDDIYLALINNLPTDQHYQKFHAPYESRLFFNLSPAGIAGLAPFWTEFEQWIHSQAFLERMARRFLPHLQEVQQQRAEQIAVHGTADRVNIGSRTLITRDYADYRLGPHTDAAAKFITALFYLPSDDRFSAFGTSLYRPKASGQTDWRSRHFNHQDFELVKTVPNLPNSVFIFAKSDRSFHGVSPGNYSNDGRDLMMWIPEIGLTERNWRPRQLPCSHFVRQQETSQTGDET